MAPYDFIEQTLPALSARQHSPEGVSIQIDLTNAPDQTASMACAVAAVILREENPARSFGRVLHVEALSPAIFEVVVEATGRRFR